MSSPNENPETIDKSITDSEILKHLDILGTAHYFVGGFICLFGCFPIIHLVIGIQAILGNLGPETPPFFGWFFIIIATSIMAGFWATGICTILAGKYLKKRTRRIFCIVIAALLCGFAPIGTVVGVFSILTLTKEQGKKLFA